MDINWKLRILAGILLIISAFTHVIQIFIISIDWHDIFAAVFGVIYALIGILLIKFQNNRSILIMGIIIPLTGGVLGTIRLVVIEIALYNFINYFIVFHLIIDCIVVPICLYLYLNLKKVEVLADYKKV
ncbi:MAG: hypothetical protein ACTSQI_09305 [Candidatus Helarchaeota archaeon]